jgi:hypothetical protein
MNCSPGSRRIGLNLFPRAERHVRYHRPEKHTHLVRCSIARNEHRSRRAGYPTGHLAQHTHDTDGKLNVEANLRGDHWSLMVDYWPAVRAYAWVLFPPFRPARGSVSGEDTPVRIADRVCTVVTGQGASVR